MTRAEIAQAILDLDRDDAREFMERIHALEAENSALEGLADPLLSSGTHAGIGARLMHLRLGADLDRAQLAREAGLSSEGVRLIEAGERMPRLETVSAWAEACGRVAVLVFSKPALEAK